MTDWQKLVATGIFGLIASVLVGIGEFLLHYDPLARYAQGFMYFKGVSQERASLGHFIGVLGAPLYVVGAWHLNLMLQPASRVWARIVFFVMAYGCIIGAVWIGSRATAALIVTGAPPEALQSELALYELRYENLLTIVRAAVLMVSGIFVWLVLTGRSLYPRWTAALNPILLIMASFLVFWLAPQIGKYLMPIALNVAYFILFSVSTAIAFQSDKEMFNDQVS